MSDNKFIKPWGHYTNLYQDERTLIKIIHVNPKQKLSLQSHEFRNELWFCKKGVGKVTYDGREFTLKEEETITIQKQKKHRLENCTNSALEIIEIQYGEHISEEDIIRYKDHYGRLVNTMKKDKILNLEYPIVIAEIGCNHRGDMKTAAEMIQMAAQFCKVDVVKFQKRCNKELLSEKEYYGLHPNPSNSYGATYGEHREFLEFDLEQNKQLQAVCKEWGIIYSTSVWDPTSAKEIISIEPELIKVPSAINTDERVLEILFKDFSGQVHISLGMTSRIEEERIVELADQHKRLKDVVLYHCISGYPVDNKELYLNEIQRLKSAYEDKVHAIGFSGHHKGIAVDVAALALGAKWFERHFTLDRTWKGTDHSASLEPEGMRRVKRDLCAAKVALQTKPVEILPIEEVQRNKLKKFISVE